MSRAKKETHLAELEQTLAAAKGAVFVGYQGMKVKELESLRRRLRAGEMSLLVTKNRILWIALQKQRIEIDAAILDTPLALAASSTDGLAPAKAVVAAQKEAEALRIAGGLLGAEYLAPVRVEMLAALPGRDELRAKLVGILAAPLIGLVRTLQAPMSNLVSILKQFEEQQT